jgi:hypothetical protein
MNNLHQRVADFLLDFHCELYGVSETVVFLKSSGFTKQECLALHLDASVVETIFNSSI